MKRLILFIVIVIPLLGRAQVPQNIDTAKMEFTQVITVDGMDAKALYSNAKFFIAKAFVSAKHVTQMDDANSNTIVAKGAFIVPVHVKGSFSYIKEFPAKFTLQIRTKDGKYQYVLNDFFVDSPDNYYDGYNLSQRYMTKKGEVNKKAHQALWDEMKRSTYRYVSSFIDEMKTEMKKNNDF